MSSARLPTTDSFFERRLGSSAMMPRPLLLERVCNVPARTSVWSLQILEDEFEGYLWVHNGDFMGDGPADVFALYRDTSFLDHDDERTPRWTQILSVTHRVTHHVTDVVTTAWGFCHSDRSLFVLDDESDRVWALTLTDEILGGRAVVPAAFARCFSPDESARRLLDFRQCPAWFSQRGTGAWYRGVGYFAGAGLTIPTTYARVRVCRHRPEELASLDDVVCFELDHADAQRLLAVVIQGGLMLLREAPALPPLQQLTQRHLAWDVACGRRELVTIARRLPADLFARLEDTVRRLWFNGVPRTRVCPQPANPRRRSTRK